MISSNNDCCNKAKYVLTCSGHSGLQKHVGYFTFWMIQILDKCFSIFPFSFRSLSGLIKKVLIRLQVILSYFVCAERIGR